MGVVGYFYDRRPMMAATRSRVRSSGVLGDVGPQIEYVFQVGNMQGYVDLDVYWEFAAQTDRMTGMRR
jgi:hypothetical protein